MQTTPRPNRPRPTPSVVTSVAPGTTVVITNAPVSNSPSATPTPKSSSGDGGSNVAGIAAGVVVGVVAVIAIATGIFFFMRHKRRKEAEEEYKRTQVSDFMRGGDKRPPPTGYSNMSDSRLDPEAGNRRDSHGSIADDQDFSRRILRVANPDTSGR
ncbi:Stress-activated PKC1-MPK1 kinase pathway sensor [Vermiconidia calcicola]|uniref:Stress-activated PKC1-MPK1 kinase pathway sensor n=1 Tax=Vermiconidia calcicola TaxID=1690605 RepID=A0ACC3NKP4_9PEZI|nr:Stress-activated PKC1-MPK1 kinase pathway sensor [Vermiconidia calcicola]